MYIWEKRVIITPPIQLVNSEGLVTDEGYTYADLTIIKIMRALRDDKRDLNSVGIALKHLFERLGAPSQGWSDTHLHLVGNKINAEKLMIGTRLRQLNLGSE